MTEIEKKELKKLIHEVLDERFGCQHQWVYDNPSTSAMKRCNKCGTKEFDSLYAEFAGIKLWENTDTETIKTPTND